LCVYSANETVARKPSFTHQTTLDSTCTDILEYNSRFVFLLDTVAVESKLRASVSIRYRALTSVLC